MKPSTIKIQEWRMPTITDADQRMIHKGYRAFFARRGKAQKQRKEAK